MKENEKQKFSSPALWQDFSYYLSYQNRYVLGSDLCDFIKLLMKTAKKREEIVKEKTIYFRARTGHQPRTPRNRVVPRAYALPKTKMGNPPSDKAKEGRINPKGISYLYLSSSLPTAIAETRPWINDFVSVAECVILRDLKVINVNSNVTYTDVCISWKENATQEEMEKRIWYDIKYWFSCPANVTDTSVNYIATQYFSELLKEEKYDGIAYPSSLSAEGYNLTLFNPRNCSVKGRGVLYKIDGLDYRFHKHKNI